MTTNATIEVITDLPVFLHHLEEALDENLDRFYLRQSLAPDQMYHNQESVEVVYFDYNDFNDNQRALSEQEQLIALIRHNQAVQDELWSQLRRGMELVAVKTNGSIIVVFRHLVVANAIVKVEALG